MKGKAIVVVSVIMFILSLVVFGVAVFVATSGKSSGSPKKDSLQTFVISDVSANIGATGRYFKGDFVLAYQNKKTLPAIEARLNQINDYLRDLILVQDIAKLMTLEGKNKMRNDIKNRVNQLIESNDIQEVYMTDFIVQ